LGNHDELLLKLHGLSVAWLGDGFKSVNVEGQEIVLCHYAMREWHHALQGVWHLFGHTHAALGPYGKSVDVGVDNAYAVLSMPQFTPESYRPISFAELKAFMDKQPLGLHPMFAGVAL
jgi:calcineurin-like phosphoesterase family protein